jgi:hypothetical protein
MRDSIASTALNLSDMTVLTEAASGAYGVTPVIAALANARKVYAFTRTTRHGTVAEVTEWTNALAAAAGVADRISVIESLSPDILKEVDIITNSGHLRPISSEVIQSLPPRAVIALMFEAWEFRPGDIDCTACLQRRIPIVGVNERYPSVDVFSFLGPLCVRLLHDAGIPVYKSRIALLCDNGFEEPMLRGLQGAGASASGFQSVASLPADHWDAVVVLLQPATSLRVNAEQAAHLASVMPRGALVAQFWGDMDRDTLISHGLEVWPPTQPHAGHMAILLSAIGPDPIVRLQTGGLRAAEYIFRGGVASADSIAQPVNLASLSK